MVPILSVEGLSYDYGERRALDDLTFALPAGRFCALLGPNGAGKSTLFSLLTRLRVAPKGTINVDGQSLVTHPRHALAKIGVVFQQMTLDLDLSVERNLFYFAALHGLPKSLAASRIEDALERLDMAERRHERARDLNGGHRRRMEIARALIHRPKLLLLDEPTVGLDAASRASVTKYTHSLVETGISVLWATHLVDEIDDSDLVLVIHKGKLLAIEDAGALRGDMALTDRFAQMTGAQMTGATA